MRAALERYWQIIRRPSAHFSLGFLTVGGFVGGIMFWGGFNTAMEFTNTETFCTGCHEMRDNPFAELKYTIHFTNRSGVRAKCSDCHVPHEWTVKMARKIQASKEVWGKIFGTIDTPEKFQAKRLELAQREWARFRANDSLECRNCHDYEYMDFTRQSLRAQHMHSTYLASKDKTCIDCHKGIAHRLPHIPPGESPSDTPGQVVPRGEGQTFAPSGRIVAKATAHGR
ncbi:MAG TPA: NapC/NirT family cytochrome c [Burkholderiales bacterium]|nr:NapC/NirT family cytochrome c [Burkholderiales bacterium]